MSAPMPDLPRHAGLLGLPGDSIRGYAYSADQMRDYARRALLDASLLTREQRLECALTQLAFMARTSGNPTPELIRACEGAEALIGKTMEANHG